MKTLKIAIFAVFLGLTGLSLQASSKSSKGTTSPKKANPDLKKALAASLISHTEEQQFRAACAESAAFHQEEQDLAKALIESKLHSTPLSPKADDELVKKKGLRARKKRCRVGPKIV